MHILHAFKRKYKGFLTVVLSGGTLMHCLALLSHTSGNRVRVSDVALCL